MSWHWSSRSRSQSHSSFGTESNSVGSSYGGDDVRASPMPTKKAHSCGRGGVGNFEFSKPSKQDRLIAKLAKNPEAVQQLKMNSVQYEQAVFAKAQLRRKVAAAAGRGGRGNIKKANKLQTPLVINEDEQRSAFFTISTAHSDELSPDGLSANGGIGARTEGAVWAEVRAGEQARLPSDTMSSVDDRSSLRSISSRSRHLRSKFSFSDTRSASTADSSTSPSAEVLALQEQLKRAEDRIAALEIERARQLAALNFERAKNAADLDMGQLVHTARSENDSVERHEAPVIQLEASIHTLTLMEQQSPPDQPPDEVEPQAAVAPSAKGKGKRTKTAVPALPPWQPPEEWNQPPTELMANHAKALSSPSSTLKSSMKVRPKSPELQGSGTSKWRAPEGW